MKKIAFLIAILILFNSFIFYSVADSTTNTPLYLTNYFSTYYFDNLEGNYGLNYKGSCGYIAIAMLLSYYDTYWNDYFIDDYSDQICVMPSNRFEYQDLLSPGIKREPSYAASADMQSSVRRPACTVYFR